MSNAGTLTGNDVRAMLATQRVELIEVLEDAHGNVYLHIIGPSIVARMAGGPGEAISDCRLLDGWIGYAADAGDVFPSAEINTHWMSHAASFRNDRMKLTGLSMDRAGRYLGLTREEADLYGAGDDVELIVAQRGES